MKRDLTQLNKLERYLEENGIRYERFDREELIEQDNLRYELERHQIYVPSSEKAEWDVICQRGSYGAEKGLLEIYGSIVRANAGDSVEGYLTAEDVIERIEEVNNKLKPCPFCGKTHAEIVAVFPDEYVIVCNDCGVGLLPSNEAIYCKDELIARWNRRVNDG